MIPIWRLASLELMVENGRQQDIDLAGVPCRLQPGACLAVAIKRDRGRRKGRGAPGAYRAPCMLVQGPREPRGGKPMAPLDLLGVCRVRPKVKHRHASGLNPEWRLAPSRELRPVRLSCICLC